MIYPAWRYTGQSVIGTRHQRGGLPCQDAHRVELVGALLVAVVADGAGSARYAEIGAQLAATEAIAAIKAWPTVPNSKATWESQLLAAPAARTPLQLRRNCSRHPPGSGAAIRHDIQLLPMG